MKNWRPISLLNVVYKLASSVIANRVKQTLQDIIHENQKGFIAGRFIGENIRLIYDVLFETKQQNIPGLILSIDFEKAFDTVSWTFISKTLDYFNFGESIKKWIHIFQKGAETSILQNGLMSEFFLLKRGCRQGDPLSLYIFLLCADVLGQIIRKNINIKGIVINNKEMKISQYADDTQILLDGTERSLRESLQILSKFFKLSGLKINEEKTRAIWIGAKINSNDKLCNDYKLDWTQGPVKILGVTFTTNVYDIWTFNSVEILNKVKSMLKQWSKRKLTLFRRITIIKSLALSKFVSLFVSLPNPPAELIKELEVIFFKFLWNAGPERITRKVAIKNLSLGGLRMPHIYSFIKALKISWLRRVIQQANNTTWHILNPIDFDKVLSLGGEYARSLAINLRNPFWKDVLISWADFCREVKPEEIKSILSAPLWFNSHLRNGNNLYVKNWDNKGIKTIGDILDNNGIFYTFDTLKEIYGVRGTFLNYENILHKIPNQVKNIINEKRVFIYQNRYNITCNVFVAYLLKDKKGSRRFYDILAHVDEMNVTHR